MPSGWRCRRRHERVGLDDGGRARAGSCSAGSGRATDCDHCRRGGRHCGPTPAQEPTPKSHGFRLPASGAVGRHFNAPAISIVHPGGDGRATARVQHPLSSAANGASQGPSVIGYRTGCDLGWGSARDANSWMHCPNRRASRWPWPSALGGSGASKRQGQVFAKTHYLGGFIGGR